jgi:hypothetical protein
LNVFELTLTDGATKPLFANQDEANEPGLSRRPAGRTSAPPPGARIGGPLYMNWGICNWIPLEDE